MIVQDEKKDLPDELGFLLMLTIALLDVTKGKLHPMVDVLNVLSVTEKDLKGSLLSFAGGPQKALARSHRDALTSLKGASEMMRSVAESMDVLIRGIEEELDRQREPGQ